MQKQGYKVKLISGQGETERLIIKDSVIEELDKLQQINEASDYIEQWVGWKTAPDYAFRTLTEGNLPLEGIKECFKVQTIYLKETNEIIGIIELYHGYPAKNILCIGWLFIHPQHQKSGYAEETVKYIFNESKKAAYNKIRLGIHLKNLPALRFWHKVGFDKIVNIVGDTAHSENTIASIILEKDLGMESSS